MSMKKISVVSCLCMFVHFFNLFASDGVYVGGQLGLNLVKDSSLFSNSGSLDLEFDPGLEINGIWGLDLGEIRIEGELGYQKNDVDAVNGSSGGGDTDILYGLISGYYEWELDNDFTPYIGVGIGFAKLNLSLDPNFDEDEIVPVYQIGFGLSYAINRSWEVDLGYKLFLTQDPEFDDDLDIEGEYLSHKFFVGLRYSFR